MEIWRYYRILRKRRWLILVGTVVCVGIVAAMTYLSPLKWEAYSKVMEKSPADEKVSIYTAPYLYQLDPRLRLANLGQLVKSGTVLERSAATLSSLRIHTRPEEILRTLKVAPLLDTMILVISVRSTSQDQANATVDVVTAEFIRYYNEINYGGAGRSKRFIESEMPKAEARLREKREELRKFKEENGVVMLPHQTDILLQQMSQFQSSASQYEVEARQAAAKVESLEEQLKDYPQMRPTSEVMASNPVWQSLQVELAKQEIDLQRMFTTRTSAHPEVEVLQGQIAETRRKMEEAAEFILNSTTMAADPIYDTLAQNLVSAFVEYSSAEAARSAAEAVIASLEPELQSLPAKEMQLAQLTVDEEAAKNTYALLRQKLDEATIKEQEAESVSGIQIVDPGKTAPADPRKVLKLILALLLSPIFCSGIALLLNYLDNTLKTPAEAEQLLKLPVLAVVPMTKSHSLVSERHLPLIGTCYQMLSANLWIGDIEMHGRTILIASAEPDVGRSTTAANLAVTLARDGARVILVDSDLRQPAQHIIFGIENDRGLSNVLAGQLALKEALKPTSVTDLLLIPAGPASANPIRLFRSQEMAKCVSAVNELADFVIFDSPAGIAFADGALLAALVKNVVIVHAAGTVPRGAEDEFGNRLKQVESNLLGVVLNMVKPEDSHGYYHFMSAYGDLTRDAKSHGVLSGRMQDGVSGEIGEVTDRTGNTES